MGYSYLKSVERYVLLSDDEERECADVVHVLDADARNYRDLIAATLGRDEVVQLQGGQFTEDEAGAHEYTVSVRPGQVTAFRAYAAKKAKTEFDCSVRTTSQRMAVRRYLYDWMKSKGMRNTDIHMHLDFVVTLSFIPSAAEIEAIRLGHSAAAIEALYAARTRPWSLRSLLSGVGWAAKWQTLHYLDK